MVNFSVFFLLFFAAIFSYYLSFQYRRQEQLSGSYPIKYVCLFFEFKN